MQSSDTLTVDSFRPGDRVVMVNAAFGGLDGPDKDRDEPTTEGYYADLVGQVGTVSGDKPHFRETVKVEFGKRVVSAYPWRLHKFPITAAPRSQGWRPQAEIDEFDRKFDEAVQAAEEALLEPLDPTDKKVRADARRLIEKDRTEGVGALDTEDLRPLLALAQHVLVTNAGPAALAVGEYEDPFADIAQELIEIHDRKGADYGSATDPYTNVRMSEAFGLPAWVGVSVRMNDKMVRLQTAVRQYLTDGQVHLKQEGLLDIANDFAVYGIILRIMIEEAQASGELTDASEGNL